MSTAVVPSQAVSRSSTEIRALKLLGDGLAPDVVASALGVSPSRISQLLSDEQFSMEVAELRYKNLAAHTERDAKYDSLEDQLIDRLKGSLGMLFDPMKIVKILQVINSAKRRGASTPEHLTAKEAVVQLNMPTQIFQQFVTNVNNQVIKAGTQELITVQSSQMTKLLEQAKALKGTQDVQESLPASVGRNGSA